MASPEVLDFEKLLAPIAGEKATGGDPRANSSPTSPYYAIKDARSAARAAERQLLMDEQSGANPDWRPVLQHGLKALSTEAKDLEIAAYVVEALVRLQGFPGLRDGFRLIRELVEKYWDDLYPLPDEEGIETRIAPLTGLNGEGAEGTLISPINNVPLTEGGSTGPFAQLHYQQAGAIAQLADEEAREKRIAQGQVSMDVFERAVSETPGPFFVNLVEDLNHCQEEFAKATAVLDEKCGAKAPPTSDIRAALTACLDTVQSVARDKLAAAEPSAEGEAEAGAAGDGAPSGPAGPIKSREDAFRSLLKVADFFRRTEPHTPVSYALEQAVRWGRMTLPELMAELLPDDSARKDYFKQVGIRTQEGES